MPRKQRFKPSRKPKPIPAAQAQEAAERERPGVHADDMTGAPESDRPEPAGGHRSPRREGAEAQ